MAYLARTNIQSVLLLLAALTLSACSQIVPPTELPHASLPKTELPGYLGIIMAAEPIGEAQEDRALVRVVAVVPGSSADLAGLQSGDILVSLDGEPIERPRKEVTAFLRSQIQSLGAGTELVFKIKRRTVSDQLSVDGQLLETTQSGLAGSVVIPHWERLLNAYPNQRVTLEGRVSEQEKLITTVLSPKPGTEERELPENAILRPDLAKADISVEEVFVHKVIRLSPSQAALNQSYQELLKRFEKDQMIDDPFRLNTVRYLHRDPLKLSLATRSLGADLQQVQSGKQLNLDQLIKVARAQLDLPNTSVLVSLPIRPLKRATAAEHGRYLEQLLALAQAKVDQAFVELSIEERGLLAQVLPTLAEQFSERLFLYLDDDVQRLERHNQALNILKKVDLNSLVAAAEVMSVAIEPDYLSQLESDLRLFEQQQRDPVKVKGVKGEVLWHSEKGILFAGSGNNQYLEGFPVIIDLGGSDQYRVPVAAARPDSPIALLIDLGGDDRYQSTQAFAQGTGFMGVGILYDHAGNDRYTSNQPFAQGSALSGVGLLIDRRGDDLYRGIRFTQASALGKGFAAVVDGSGDDEFDAGGFAQGFAGPGAFTALISKGGDDRYHASGLYRSSYSNGVGIYKGFSQGVGVGFRHQASGGIGVLLDDGGEDAYEAGNFSQGGGYYFGWGALIDLGLQSDAYEGSRYAQGFASHSALGSFWDQGGDDYYQSWVGAANSAAWDLSATIFLDDAGDDFYAKGHSFSLGASAHNGLALFLDRQGKDTYQVYPASSGPNNYHGGPSLSFFVDAGGDEDSYLVNKVSNNQVNQRGESGIILDLPLFWGQMNDQEFKRLLEAE
ncbi:PDZ domain-containing protein [Neptuniibacter sp. PT34_22]|uniref:PDZ domain-containing protein n=1 Tax=Neptuniibacter sp. PT34_22 TaxID=3398205 RepID=UPI0039F57722